jgi:pimeloyl-ACP methyl ester carboxylesterase
MAKALEGLTGWPVRIVPVTRLDWVAAVSEVGWERILLKLHQTVVSTLADAGQPRVILIGHSSGGVVGRLYLSPEPFRGHRFNGVGRVRDLVTLGSPHGNVRGARMRRWVDRTLPGAFFAPTVSYTTVCGAVVKGDSGGGAKARLVHFLYRKLCGRGNVWGDGIVPVESARLDGATNLVLDGVSHAPMGGRRWYGSPEVVQEWWAMMGKGDATAAEEPAE